MSFFPDNVAEPPPVPGPVTAAERAEHTPQYGMGSHDDPEATVAAAGDREWRLAASSLSAANNPEAGRAFQIAMGHVAAAQKVARDLDAVISSTLDNGALTPANRQTLITTAISTARAEVQRRLDSADGNLIAAEAQLDVAALPEAPADREVERQLREDLKIRLEGLSGHDLRLELGRLAAGPDRALAGLIVHGSVTEAHLSRLPKRDQEEARRLIHASAIEGSRQHGTLIQRRYAEATSTAIPAARKALAARTFNVQRALEAATDKVPRW